VIGMLLAGAAVLAVGIILLIRWADRQIGALEEADHPGPRRKGWR
jgi:hypothetical protein